MNRNEFRLFSEISKLSIADDWDLIKKEWELEYVYYSDVADECPCGHYPITTLCNIKNIYNNKRLCRFKMYREIYGYGF